MCWVSVKERFDILSNNLWKIRKECEELLDTVELEMDKKAIQDIIVDLDWACENLTVVGLHQINQELDDNMGTGINPNKMSTNTPK